eukprot:372438-Hanusia_phi.AAC.2
MLSVHRVACSKEFVFKAILPKVDLSNMPDVGLSSTWPCTHLGSPGTSAARRRQAEEEGEEGCRRQNERKTSCEGLALDDAAAALFGHDEALEANDSVRVEEQEGDARGEKTTDDAEKQTREGEEEDGEDLEDEEDLEMDDYENAG